MSSETQTQQQQLQVPSDEKQSRREVSNPKWELEISKRLEEEFKARKDLERRLEEAVRARVALEELCRRLTEKLREQNSRWDSEVKKMKARILLELADAKERVELELEETKEKVIEEICQKNENSGDLLTRLFAPKKREERAQQREKEKEGNRKREEERKKNDEKEKRKEKKRISRRKSNSHQKRKDEDDSDTSSQRSGKDSDDEGDSSSEAPREHDIVLLDKFLKDRPTLQKLEERNIIKNSEEANKEKIRVEESIDRFLQHRTPKEVLQKKGILAENLIFGMPLDDLLEGGHIPKFVRKAIEVLKASDAKQLFLTPADSAVVMARKAALESSGDIEFGKTEDPHLIAGLLLEFLLELAQPLIPFRFYEKFLEAIDIEDELYLISVMHSLVFDLPSTYRVVLQFLINFLQSLLEKSDASQLSIEKLSQIFGPLILRPVLDYTGKSPYEFASIHPHKAQASKVFTTLVAQYSPIFIGEDNDIKYMMKDGHQVVKQAKLDKLVSKLVDELYTSRDDDFIDAFLLTYRYFTTPYLLLEKLIGLYTSLFDSKDPSKKWQLDFRLRILIVIKKWIINYRNDLAAEKDFCDRLCFFVSRTTNITEQESSIFSVYRDWIEKLDEPAPVIQEVNSTAPVVPLDLLAKSPADICAQLTLIDHSAFKKMKVQELLGKAFLKPEKSPDFTAMVNQFNKWCHWIPTEILKRETPAQRAEVISKFIQIAKECKNISNFNTCFAIVCGLQNSSISRLKYSWEKVPKKENKIFTKLLDLFSLNKNYKNYRELLNSAHTPLVPYLAVFPKDIFAIEENHPNINDDGTVNFTKYRLLWQILKKVISYQSSDYPLKPDPELRASLRAITVITEEEQFQRSLVVEPKETSNQSN